MATPSRRYDRDAAIVDGGWGAQVGRDTLWQQLEDGYLEGPDSVALICAHQQPGHLEQLVGRNTIPDQDCLTWTYRQLMVASKNLALALSKCGVKRGDSIVAFLPTCAEWALLYWIAATLELTFVPVAPESLSSCCKSQDYPLELLKPSVVIVGSIKDAWEFEMLYPDITEAAIFKLVCFEHDNLSWNSWMALDCLVEEIPPTDPTRDIPERPNINDKSLDADRVAVVLFTDGNSDFPSKGCPLTVSNLRNGTLYRHCVASQRHLITTPLSGVIALETAIMAWKSGGAVVLPEEKFTVESTLNTIESHACTDLICTPDQVRDMKQHPLLGLRKLNSLKSLSLADYGDEGPLLEEAKEAFNIPWATFLFSMPEGFGIIGWYQTAQPFDTQFSIGTVLGGSRVKICDERKQICKKDEEGEVHVSGEAVIRGYLGGISASSFYLGEEAHRWFVTGYMAIVEEDNHFYITGRKATLGGDEVRVPPRQDVGQADEQEDEQRAKSEVVPIEVNHGSLGVVTIAVVRSLKPANGISTIPAGTWAIPIEQLGRAEWPVNEAGEVIAEILEAEVVALLKGLWS